MSRDSVPLAGGLVAASDLRKSDEQNGVADEEESIACEIKLVCAPRKRIGPTATRWIVSSSFLALTLVTPAAAQSPRVLEAFPPGSPTVFVFKAGKLGEAMQLKNAGVWKTNPKVVVPLVACTVDPGTQVVVTDTHMFSGYSEVVIVNGPAAGCRGEIYNEHLSGKATTTPSTATPGAMMAFGRVAAVSADRLVVKGKAKGTDAEWAMVLDAKMKIKKGGKNATAGDLKVGDVVSVRYTEQDGKNVAQSVLAKAAEGGGR
jgi:hypothetical protein